MLDQAQVANLLGVSDRQLRRWQTEPGFPDCTAGYEIQAIKAWRDARQLKGSEEADAGRRIKLARDAERLKRDKIVVQKEDLLLREMQKELLPRAAWELFAATLLTHLSDRLNQLPDIIAADTPRKYQRRIADRLRRELDSIRRELRSSLEGRMRELDDDR